jgi:hypothetical protein
MGDFPGLAQQPQQAVVGLVADRVLFPQTRKPDGTPTDPQASLLLRDVPGNIQLDG